VLPLDVRIIKSAESLEYAGPVDATDKAKDHGYGGSSNRRRVQIRRARDVVMPERILISAELEIGVGRYWGAVLTEKVSMRV